MRKTENRRIPQITVLLMAAALLVPTTASAGPADMALATSAVSAAAATDPAIDLCATTGTLTLPGGVASVPIWGFVHKGAAADCSDVAGTATLPGPVLDVNQSDVITLNVTNALPPGHDISIEVPGVSFDPGGSSAPVGGTVSRTFTASAPGTYLYQSVGDGERQTAMGLYGALIVRPTTAGRAYDSAASAYDVEAPLVLSAIDPAFNANPDSFDTRNYLATYWLINGKAYPQTNVIHAAAGQRVLLRYVNAGYDNTTMTLLGMHENVIARDAHLLVNAFDADAETIPAGETEDVVATVPASSSAFVNGFPVYNRQLHVVNGTTTNPAYSPGGMMTFIQAP
jgi:FtsP/CotA-like multicopper oxidase with cupredoxin domain